MSKKISPSGSRYLLTGRTRIFQMANLFFHRSPWKVLAPRYFPFAKMGWDPHNKPPYPFHNLPHLHIYVSPHSTFVSPFCNVRVITKREAPSAVDSGIRFSAV